MKIKLLIFALTAFLLFPCSYPRLSLGAEATYRILAIQHQSFTPYELSFQGFMKGIEESEYSGRIEVERYNAKSNIKKLARKIIEIKGRKDIDLIFTLGTRATKAAMEEIKNIPIVFTDLGAPEHSGIIKDWKSSETNVTGVETPRYLGKGIDLLHQLIPFKKIGMIYLEGSPSHEGAIKEVKLICKNLGTEFVSAGFPLKDQKGNNFPQKTLTRRISDELENVLPRVDVFFVQTSKTFDDNFNLFLKAFKKHGIVSAGDPLYIKKGIVLGLGRNKFEFGRQCAQYAVKIFNGATPSDLPMDVGSKFSILFNLKASAIVGFTPPLDLLGAADAIYQDIEIDEN